MDQAGLWLTPLILLPGVALLVISTSARYGRVHDEAHHLFAHEHEASPEAIVRLKRRARLFRDALVCLYVCIGLFALSSLLGMIAGAWVGASEWVGAAVLVVGTACLFMAALQLIREALLSLEIVEDHLQRLDIHDHAQPT